MTNSWKEWQGRTINGKFVLGTYLGGSGGSAVFRTRIGAGSADDGSTDNGSTRVGSSGGADVTPAAIKLLVADGAEAESLLRRWETAMRLSHPNLIRILSTGRVAVDGRVLVYAVEEFAEENLAQILPERSLTAGEARAMLSPVVSALAYVNGRGMVHGAIRPSNILAAGDQVKLSSDSLRPAGEIPRTISLYDAPEVLSEGISPASDVWSLGMTLVEVLTQHLPAWDPPRMSPPEIGPAVPEPFREISRLCLMLDPAKRCSLQVIADRLQSTPIESRARNEAPDRGEVPGEVRERARGEARPSVKPAPVAADKPLPVGSIAASQKKTTKGPYLLVVAAAIAVIIFLMVRPRPSSGPDQARTSSTPAETSSLQTAQSPPSQSPPSHSQTPSQQTGQTPPAETPSAHAPTSQAMPSSARPAPADEILERATPQVSATARRTISGKLKVRVRVAVDAAGNVTEAKLKDAGPSKYFARVALEAARRWKFAPAPDANRREWTLQFAFTHARTEMSATHAH